MLTAIISVCFFLLYYVLIGYSLHHCGFFLRLKQLKRREILMGSMMLLVVGVYWWWLVNQDNAVVFWDRGSYYVKSLKLIELIKGSPSTMLESLYESINHTDYSDLAPTIHSAPMAFFKLNTYAKYRLLLFVMYQLPADIILADVASCVLEKIGLIKIKSKYILSLFVTVCFPFLYMPTVFGLFDVSDLPIVALIALVLVNKSFRKFDLKSDILLSVLFLVLLFLRRHFAFFALGYFGFYVIVELVTVLKRKDKKEFRCLIMNLGIIAVICSSVLLLFFREYLDRTLNNSYNIQYSAWSRGNLIDKFIDSGTYIGYWIVGISIIGAIVLIVKRQIGHLVVLLGSMLFILLMFFRIQSLSVQHYYNISLQIIVLSVIGMAYIIENSRSRVPLAVFALLLVGSFASCMIPKVDLRSFKIFSSQCYTPPTRNDMNELGRLVSDVQSFTADGDYAYCCCSSQILNEDIFFNYELPENINACPYLYPTYHTDLAAGFPDILFEAKYVIVTDPAQTHAVYERQRIIWYLNDLIIDPNSIFADNYRRVSEYMLDENTHAYIYEKVSDCTYDDYQVLLDAFDEWYPEYPEIFADRIIACRDASR